MKEPLPSSPSPDGVPTVVPPPAAAEDSEATHALTAGPSSSSSPSVAPAAPPARRFHHYEVCVREDGATLWELGHGAMGVSYKARDVNLDTPVAIKVIRAGLPGAVHARERFRREARAAARLRHPNVASVFHFGETPGGDCFYAMEFIAGETLAERVKRDGPLPHARVVEIGRQVCAALVAAEERGLVHRDLKPANLMLVAPSSPARTGTVPAAAAAPVQVKVIDFGLAKAVAGSDTGMDREAPLTQIGGFFGTPAYSSPEQAEGAAVDARSDIFSLGATLWFALTGQVPFAGTTLGEIHDRQLHRPLPLTMLREAHTPEPLVELLASMLASRRDRRPASPAVLLEALDECRRKMDGGGAWNVPGLPPAAGRGGSRGTKALAGLAGILLVAGLGLGAFWWSRQRAATAQREMDLAAPDKSIAVLPLEDLSEDKSYAFFADGIQDDLLSSLAKIKDLKVISRSSVMGYRPPVVRDLREIGQSLGVGTILEGSVRRAPDRVLVNVALIDARNGRRLWAERYDRTLSDALTLQGEVATEIASALRARLSPEEKVRVETRPTDNAEAYVLYLRARDFQTRPFSLLQDLQTAERLYREALALDPNFALARARLAATLAFIFVNFQPTTELHDQARTEAEAALRLRPDLGEAHLARALCLYWTERDYAAALGGLDVASPLMPGSHEVELMSGAIRRRQGRWGDSLANMRRALSRDPRNAQIAREIMFTDLMLREWAAVARDGDRAVALAPDNPMILVERSCLALWTRGDLGPLRAALDAAPAGFDPDGEITLFRWQVACLARDFDAAERAVSAGALESVVTTFGAVLPKSYLLGSAALARGDLARARPLLEAACAPMEAEAQRVPRDAFRQGYLGLLYAYLGRKEDALRLGRRAVELMPEAKDPCFGPIPSGLLAAILARAGERDEAVALIGRLLRTPAAVSPAVDTGISLNELRLSWQWDPLREDSRFQALLAGPEPKTFYK